MNLSFTPVSRGKWILPGKLFPLLTKPFLKGAFVRLSASPIRLSYGCLIPAKYSKVLKQSLQPIDYFYENLFFRQVKLPRNCYDNHMNIKIAGRKKNFFGRRQYPF